MTTEPKRYVVTEDRPYYSHGDGRTYHSAAELTRGDVVVVTHPTPDSDGDVYVTKVYDLGKDGFFQYCVGIAQLAPVTPETDEAPEDDLLNEDGLNGMDAVRRAKAVSVAIDFLGVDRLTEDLLAVADYIHTGTTAHTLEATDSDETPVPGRPQELVLADKSDDRFRITIAGSLTASAAFVKTFETDGGFRSGPAVVLSASQCREAAARLIAAADYADRA